MKIEKHDVMQDDDDAFAARPRHIATVAPASREMVEMVLAADEHGHDGRSPFVWVRLANGDLLLGVFPQGETYFETENDEGRP